MNTRQLKYVLTLARAGSFSRAAMELGISQPSLSQYIKKIEQEVGAALFDRTNGDVRITDAGRAYLDAGRKILDLEHQLDVQLSDLAESKAGSLIIGTAPYRAAGMMPTVARRFQALYPGMHLVVREGTTAELVEGMEHGEYDLCLTMLPIDGRIFHYEIVLEEELILAAPPSAPRFPARTEPERKYPAIEAEALNGQALVMLTDSQFMQRQIERLIADYRLSIRTAAVVKSLSAQIAMVKAGVGMAVMPSGIDRFCGPGEAVFYSFVQPLPKREVVVMWRRDRELSKVAEALKGIIAGIRW